MTTRAGLSFSHVGIFVTDLERMVDFYTRVLGLVVSDRDKLDAERDIAFLTTDAREHHQVVFVSGKPADNAYNMIQQLSFRAKDLASLRATWMALRKEPIVELGPISHCTAISAYFRDPEGNRLEIFIDTKWHAPQPCTESIDLAKSDEEIWAFVEAQARRLSGVVRRDAWERDRAGEFA
jgi:catechol 2,3-dioxygenase